MNKLLLRASIVTAALSLNTHAAQPKSVKYIEDIIVQGDQIYAYYIVKCSNGKNIDVSAWDSKKLWCLGKGEKSKCEKKQIKIAKLACRGG